MYEADALQAALYAALNGTITGGVYDQVPPGAAYPYTVIGHLTEEPDDLHDGEGSEITGTLHVWSAAPGTAEVNGILKEIDVVLHRGTLVITGARCWSVEREFTGPIDRDMDPETRKPLRHAVTRYRFGLEEV